MRLYVVLVSISLVCGIVLAVPNAPELEPWTELALSVPRSNIAAISTKNYAILAGGLYQNGSASDIVEVLDVSTRKISQLKLSVPRYNLLTTSVGSDAIFAGGMETVESNETTSNVKVIEILDVDSMQWKTAQFPDSFYLPERTVIASTDALVVFCNGTNLAIFDPAATSENAWILPEAFTQATSRADAAVAIGSTVYVSTNHLSSVYAIDVTNLSQFQLNSQDIALGTQITTALYIDQTVYFVGTRDRDQSATTLFIYDSQRQSWQVNLFPTQQRLSGAVAIQGNIVAVATETIDISVVAEGSWYSINFDGELDSAVTVVADNYLVVAGGTNGTDVTNALRVFEYKPPAAPVTETVPNQPQQAPPTSGSSTVSTLSVIFGAIVLLFH